MVRHVTHLIVCYWTSDVFNYGGREIDSLYRKAGYLSTPYHFVVRRNGQVEVGRPVHRAGKIDHPFAATSINVCIVLPPDKSGTGEIAKYTPAQRASAEALIHEITKQCPGLIMEVLGPIREVR